jgi:hypothetical protein
MDGYGMIQVVNHVAIMMLAVQEHHENMRYEGCEAAESG